MVTARTLESIGTPKYRVQDTLVDTESRMPHKLGVQFRHFQDSKQAARKQAHYAG